MKKKLLLSASLAATALLCVGCFTVPNPAGNGPSSAPASSPATPHHSGPISLAMK